MTIYNLGSINADHFYRVAHLPAPGETLTSDDFQTGLGGKGTNQSVAAAKAGSNVVHIGAVGADGHWAIARLQKFGVETEFVSIVDTPTGHAIINVDPNGENAIVLFAGANRAQTDANISAALRSAVRDDYLLLQNETNGQAMAAKRAHEIGMKTIYSAAPFSVEAIKDILPNISILMVNEIESQQLCGALGMEITEIPVPELIVTKGAEGADWYNTQTKETLHVPAFKAAAVDTTAAGDTFAGYFAAGLEQGMDVKAAMTFGAAASAIKVTRHGTADAIPDRSEVDTFLA